MNRRPTAPPVRTVGATFVASAWRHQRRPAFLAADGIVPWRSVVDDVRHVALGLHAAGVERRREVGVASGGDRADRLALLAAASVGAVAVPVEAVPPGCVALGHDTPSLDDLRRAGAQVDVAEPAAFESMLALVAADDPAVVLGGVTFSHANLLWGAKAFIQQLGVRAEDVVACDLRLDTAPGHVISHVVPVVSGAAVLPAWTTAECHGPPTVVVLGRTGAGRLGGARPAASGGPLSSVRARRWRERAGLGACRSLVVVDADGMADAFRAAGMPACAAASDPGVAGLLTLGVPTGRGDAGRPLPGTSVGVTEDGAVVVRSFAVAGAEAAAGWWPTGRRGALDEEGRLRLAGAPVDGAAAP